MTITIKHPVTAPGVVPYRYGVFSVAQPRVAALEGLGVDEHWRLGVTWESEACGSALVTFNACIEPETGPLTSDRDCRILEYPAFTVYAYNTDAVPGKTLAEHEQNAIARLLNGEQRAVEEVLWAQLLTADPVPTDMTGFPGWLGLGYIEQAIAETYGSEGVIHMNRFAASALSLHLRVEGGMMRTLLGTPVVVGGGYDPLPSPIESTATIFGSGPLALWRGDVDTRENAIDKALNDVSIVAQRDYVLGWDCFAVGATIELGCPSTEP